MTTVEPGHDARRERRLAETFVVLADTLVADFDLAEVHGRLARACVDVLGAAAAGIMLAEPTGGLALVAATPGATAVEALELQHDEGPCLDCYRSGEPVALTALDRAAAERWPRFAPFAAAAGFTSVLALPMRLRGRVIGALNIFGDARTAVDADDVRTAQALADVATIALLQQRAVADGEMLAAQLQSALTTRVVIEQAKGLLAERGGIDVDVAFDRMRRWARHHRVPVGAVAQSLLDGSQDARELLADRGLD